MNTVIRSQVPHDFKESLLSSMERKGYEVTYKGQTCNISPLSDSETTSLKVNLHSHIYRSGQDRVSCVAFNKFSRPFSKHPKGTRAMYRAFINSVIKASEKYSIPVLATVLEGDEIKSYLSSLAFEKTENLLLSGIRSDKDYIRYPK